MQENETVNTEACFLTVLAQLEDLAEKKMKIYSRLLTEVSLAKALEELSARHAERKSALESLACGKAKTKSKDKDEENEQ